ncbi:3-isopropylmalate dehydrogenase [Nitrospina gracilis 3/211]|uniref:3-isopropylmalate dehydrogenase n=1 Tax=Nitrospina gracilis (strain 3/211) TaxID=1266370 RepID=M1Z2J0_NITG3|nr:MULTISPECIES: 3-isopropylmalate dehydrogenase [Nitrospina]MCF8724516.1 3-isopropylmalate dehydrogenase [Nitrospina sp. Nb-3]CCQ91682.1 3-isopropylmalate dehydrogenase [Nitrospina gracilis 3/211]
MSQEYTIAVLPGDGIGPEVTAEAVKVLRVVETRLGLKLNLNEKPVGGAGYEATGHPLPGETLEAAKEADAVLLGAVGGPQWETIDFSLRPERALLGLRSELNLFANLRPAKVFRALTEASTLKPEVVEGLDILVVRELTGGIYFGEPRGVVTLQGGERRGTNTLVYTESEIVRIAKVAFDVALKRNKKVCSVDKANVLEATGLWREVVTDLHKKEFSGVELSHMYVDNAAMQLVRNPKQFDVIVTTNMFGDILSDEASMLTGSIGMLPSASLGGKTAMYEPIHGSAPDIAGKDMANPLATILSVGMMFKYSLDREDVNTALENVVESILEAGYRTKDIMSKGMKEVGCKEMGDLVVQALEKKL